MLPHVVTVHPPHVIQLRPGATVHISARCARSRPHLLQPTGNHPEFLLFYNKDHIQTLLLGTEPRDFWFLEIQEVGQDERHITGGLKVGSRFPRLQDALAIGVTLLNRESIHQEVVRIKSTDVPVCKSLPRA